MAGLFSGGGVGKTVGRMSDTAQNAADKTRRKKVSLDFGVRGDRINPTITMLETSLDLIHHCARGAR